MRRENSVVTNNTANVENGGKSMKGLFKNMKKKVIPALSGSMMAVSLMSTQCFAAATGTSAVTQPLDNLKTLVIAVIGAVGVIILAKNVMEFAQAYRRKYGHFPPWNDVGGSTQGQNCVMGNNINIVKSFCKPDQFTINPIMSRSTIRELSNNAEWEWYEIFLHTARMYLLTMGMEYKDALKFTIENDSINTYDRMKESGYLQKKLIV